jgi:hypothetical protein
MLETLALAIVLSTAPAARKSLPPNDPLAKLVELKGMEFYKRLLVEEEPKQLWKNIHWISMDEARVQAKENRKPILVVMNVRSDGRPNSAFT